MVSSKDQVSKKKKVLKNGVEKHHRKKVNGLRKKRKSS
jgi:hypothetical protein